jgi:hypothetical protein
VQLEILRIKVEDGDVVDTHDLEQIPLYGDVGRILLPGIDIKPNTNSDLILDSQLPFFNRLVQLSMFETSRQ